MTFPICTNALQKSFKRQLTSNQMQETLNFQKMIQKMKPELVKMNESAIQTNTPIRLVDIEKQKIAVHQNPEIVFNSLLHKSASRGRNGIGFEESIKYM